MARTRRVARSSLPRLVPDFVPVTVTGGKVWVAPDVVQILAVDEKYVYALRNDNVMIALDKHDGHAAFISNRHDIVTYANNPYDGTIYAVTKANRVLAISSVLKPGAVCEVVWEPVTGQNQAVALAH